MGKTQTPLNILLTDSRLLDEPTLKPIIEKMKEQGHTIETNDELSKYHFIAGPNCWYLIKEVAGLFTQAVDNARRVANANKKGTVESTTQTVAKRKPGKRSKASSKDSGDGTQEQV